MDNRFSRKPANYKADNKRRPFGGVKGNDGEQRPRYKSTADSYSSNRERTSTNNDRPRTYSRDTNNNKRPYSGNPQYRERTQSDSYPDRGANRGSFGRGSYENRNRSERSEGYDVNRAGDNRRFGSSSSREEGFVRRERSGGFNRPSDTSRYDRGADRNRDEKSSEGRFGERRNSFDRQPRDNGGQRSNRSSYSGNSGSSRGTGSSRSQYGNSNSRSYGDRHDRPSVGSGDRNEYRNRRSDSRHYSPRGYREQSSDLHEDELATLREKHYSKKKILEHRIKSVVTSENAELRLNRYISISGICSRRDADELIQSGRVKVNGEIVTKVGVKVTKKDTVDVDGETIIPEKKVYLVLNKPKDFVTTMDDPLERKTVMNLIASACKERIYPVGRLDRQTTGVLLFTNDGDLAKKLTHPSYEHKKIYHVFLDKPITPEQLQQIIDGVTLEDGVIKADEINYASENGMEVGIEIHSGKNRIVRRIFEHLGFKIEKLDRVYFAGITKKNLPRGKWRMLSKAEVDILKYY